MRNLIVIAAFLINAGISTALSADGLGEGDFELLSSVMWQPKGGDDGYVYPPGIPAVLKKSDKHRTFRIEQYFHSKTPLASGAILPHVSGTWPRTPANDLRSSTETGGWANNFVHIERPECDVFPGVHGYRCIVDLVFQEFIPTGTIGVSIGVELGSAEFLHPNAVFWIVIPEEGGANRSSDVERVKLSDDKNRELSTNQRREPPAPHSFNSMDDVAEARRMVVRITLGAGPNGETSGFIMGSGFIARDVKPLQKLFNHGAKEFGTLLDDTSVYVVTAAHLFPVGYNFSAFDERLSDAHRAQIEGFYYDLQVDGVVLNRAASLVARNIESDVALLKVRPSSLQKLSEILKVQSPAEIPGLKISEQIDTQDGGGLFTILGYPAVEQGRLVQRIGRLVTGQYPTDDTSNFGPLSKLKLEALDPATSGCGDPQVPDQCTLAEPGMSGGPIIDADGGVVGLTVERPNDTNSLIALDLTSIRNLSNGFATDEQSCLLRFNPFDRVLTLVSRKPDCDYGRFGSPRYFSLLEGEWTIQEVLGFADDEPMGSYLVDAETNSLEKSSPALLDAQQEQPFDQYAESARSNWYHFTNGHSIINGHAIINGHTIINGQSIIEKSLLLVNRRNLEVINKTQFTSGFQLNPDSFRSFVPKGVRILSRGRVNDAADDLNLGQLIVGTRESPDDHGFTPVYSIREFAIWLHSNIRNPDYPHLMCLDSLGSCGR